MITVRLPWPHAALSPNSRIHHMVRARKAKSAKISAWSLAYEAGVRRQDATPRTLTFSFHPPTRRRMDLDNVIASCKAYIDGLACALGIDDSKIAMRFPERLGEPVKGGAIVVEVTA
jgi:crossover junction endodeoxyribonuclease RusA